MKISRMVLLLCLFAGFTAANAYAHEGAAPPTPPSKNPSCVDDIRMVKGQGRSCHVAGGLWKVFLTHGKPLLTHGPDPASAFEAAEPGVVVGLRNPRCQSASNPNGNYGVRAIIAYASDDTNAKTVASFRNDIATINQKLYDESVESGSGGADYIFLCDSTGQPLVTTHQLPHTMAQSTFATISSDLRNLGYTASNQKFLVYFGSSVQGFCGQGSIFTDETDSGANNNNGGNEYAINYDCSWSVNMHELGHNLGAVQYNSPFSTGTGFHCWEGQIYVTDVMCYLDGGDKAPSQLLACSTPGFHFDCNHNDYFDARIGVRAGGGFGSYLDTHWNIGECYVRFIVNSRCIDFTAPVITKLPTPILRGNQIGTSTIPVTLSWQATDQWAICQYTLRQSVNGGPFSNVTLPSPTATSIQTNMNANTDYSWTLQSTDCNGNASPASGVVYQARKFEENATNLVFETGFTRVALSGASGGFVKYSTVAGKDVRINTTAQTIALIGTKGPGRGTVRAFYDGASTAQATQNTQATNLAVRQIIFRNNYNTTKAISARYENAGTSGHPRVDIDAIVTLVRTN